jgi:hypothetical protein
VPECEAECGDEKEATRTYETAGEWSKLHEHTHDGGTHDSGRDSHEDSEEDNEYESNSEMTLEKETY